jgi:hypothetical protein
MVRRIKQWLEFALAVGLPAMTLLLVWAEHSGLIDHWRGLDRVQAVADNFSVSYDPNACNPVYPDNPAWKPLIEIIQRYSKSPLRRDRQPQTVARFQATLSGKSDIGNEHFSEWTAPSTPFVVLYRHWPENTGAEIPRDDFTVVGTIGDLQSWITQSKDDFHFLVNDVVLTFMALTLGYWLWRIERREHRR